MSFVFIDKEESGSEKGNTCFNLRIKRKGHSLRKKRESEKKREKEKKFEDTCVNLRIKRKGAHPGRSKHESW